MIAEELCAAGCILRRPRSGASRSRDGRWGDGRAEVPQAAADVCQEAATTSGLTAARPAFLRSGLCEEALRLPPLSPVELLPRIKVHPHRARVEVPRDQVADAHNVAGMGAAEGNHVLDHALDGLSVGRG